MATETPTELRSKPRARLRLEQTGYRYQRPLSGSTANVYRLQDGWIHACLRSSTTKSVSVTGLPALLIILVLLALLITGVVVVVRAVGRKAKSKI